MIEIRDYLEYAYCHTDVYSIHVVCLAHNVVYNIIWNQFMGHCVLNSKRSCVKILILNISFVSPLFFWSFKSFVQKWTFKNTLLMLKSIDFKKEWEFTIKTYHSLRQKIWSKNIISLWMTLTDNDFSVPFK